jgi:hypothetical protein
MYSFRNKSTIIYKFINIYDGLMDRRYLFYVPSTKYKVIKDKCRLHRMPLKELVPEEYDRRLETKSNPTI